MSEYPGIFRKDKQRGWVYRYREYDPAKGKTVYRTSIEYDSARKAAAAKNSQQREITEAAIAARRPTREGITIVQAWESHPSTIRETEICRAKYRVRLDKFLAHAGYSELRKLTFADVSAWLKHLKARDLAWSTRVHYLMPLRRAARMAVTVGLPDVLNRMPIDQREQEEHAVQAWTLQEIAIAWMRLAHSRRARVALGLGAFLGLRPSEIYRLRCGDVRKDGRLAIGLRLKANEALPLVKNKPSRRLLPMPALLLEEVRALVALRPSTDPLIATIRPGHPVGFYTEFSLIRWLGPILNIATGRDLSIKCLRKSFASWTISAGIDFWHVEAYMGRETPLTKSITGRHYLADMYQVVSKQLDPTALLLDQHIRAAITASSAAFPQPINGDHSQKNGDHFGDHSRLGITSGIK